VRDGKLLKAEHAQAAFSQVVACSRPDGTDADHDDIVGFGHCYDLRLGRCRDALGERLANDRLQGDWRNGLGSVKRKGNPTRGGETRQNNSKHYLSPHGAYSYFLTGLRPFLRKVVDGTMLIRHKCRPMFTTTQLKHAAAIAEQIEKLQAELNSVLGSSAEVSTASSGPSSAPSKGKRGGKRFISEEARAKMAAAQKARWAKRKAGGAVPSAPAKANKGLTPAGRARLAAAMKARWDARKSGAPAPTASSKPAKNKGKRSISPEARAKMAEAARRRWAKVKKSK
jgi:hypothetical protein